MALDPEFKQSQDYRSLYNKRRLMKKKGMCKEWEDVTVFIEWALDNGYSTFGCTLKQIKPDKPYSPTNCRFIVDLEKKVVHDFVNGWNIAVNRIREYYGLEPFEVWADG